LEEEEEGKGETMEGGELMTEGLEEEEEELVWPARIAALSFSSCA
jgi:hypothetical protein